MKEVHLYIMHLLRRSLNYQEQVRPSLQYEIADDSESSPDPPPLLTKHLGQNIMNDDGSMKVARSEGVFQLSLQGNMQ